MNCYRELLVRRAEARKLELDIEVEIQFFEKEMELRALFTGPGKGHGLSEAQEFAQKNETRLEPDDLEFLQVEYRRIGEVSDHSQIPQTSLKRLADKGEIAEGPRTESGHRRFSTVSVMEYLLGDSKKET